MILIAVVEAHGHAYLQECAYREDCRAVREARVRRGELRRPAVRQSTQKNQPMRSRHEPRFAATMQAGWRGASQDRACLPASYPARRCAR